MVNNPATVFDPSYGLKFPSNDSDATTMDAAELAWEDASVSGYFTWYKNDAGQTKESRVPDVKGLKETKWG